MKTQTAVEVFENKLREAGLEIPNDYIYEDHILYEWFEPEDELDYIVVKVYETGKVKIQYYFDELEITRDIDFAELVRRVREWDKETKSNIFH